MHEILYSLMTRPTGQTSNVADQGLVIIQKNLYALQMFLEANPQLFTSSPGDQVVSKQTNDLDAWKVWLCLFVQTMYSR